MDSPGCVVTNGAEWSHVDQTGPRRDHARFRVVGALPAPTPSPTTAPCPRARPRPARPARLGSLEEVGGRSGVASTCGFARVSVGRGRRSVGLAHEVTQRWLNPLTACCQFRSRESGFCLFGHALHGLRYAVGQSRSQLSSSCGQRCRASEKQRARIGSMRGCFGRARGGLLLRVCRPVRANFTGCAAP